MYVSFHKMMNINNDTVVLKMRPFTEKWQGFNGKFLVCLKIVFFCHKMAILLQFWNPFTQ